MGTVDMDLLEHITMLVMVLIIHTAEVLLVIVKDTAVSTKETTLDFSEVCQDISLCRTTIQVYTHHIGSEEQNQRILEIAEETAPDSYRHRDLSDHHSIKW